MLNLPFNELGLEKHPDKTLIGRIERGLDFLGYHFDSDGLTLAKKTITIFTAKMLRLYEQESPQNKMWRLGDYLVRWTRWALCGIDVPTAGRFNLMSLSCDTLLGPPPLHQMQDWQCRNQQKR